MPSPTRAQSQAYERLNPKGFLMRVYRNMQSRCLAVQKREARFYHGLPLLPRSHFYAWALAPESVFWRLWDFWQACGRPRRLCPSIDRIDAMRGYTLDNMQWLTQAENSGKIRPEFRYRPLPQCRGENHWRAKRRRQLESA
jgi:hypothetical protein